MTDMASFYITRDELVALWHYTNEQIRNSGDKIARHGNKAFVTNAENMQKLSDRLDSLELFAKEQGWQI